MICGIGCKRAQTVAQAIIGDDLMTTKLKNLVITKVALVDEGSCSAAHIKLYKRKDEGGSQIMNEEELLKLIPEDKRVEAKAVIEKGKTDSATAAKKAAEDAADKGVDDAMENPDGTMKDKKPFAKVAAKILGLNEELAKAKAPAGTLSDDEIMKSVSPEVRAILEKARTQAAANEAILIKMRDDANASEALAKAKELPNIGAAEEELAKSFQEIKKSSPKAFESIFAVLKAANELIADSDVMKEKGTSTAELSEEALTKNKNDAWNQIELKATEIKKGMPTLTQEQAIAKAMKECPELYKKYLDNLK